MCLKRVAKLIKYLEEPTKFIPSELPTLFDVLRYVLFLRRFQAYASTIYAPANDAEDYVIIA